MFIDYAKIRLRAGNGGAGIVAFHREKYIDKGWYWGNLNDTRWEEIFKLFKEVKPYMTL